MRRPWDPSKGSDGRRGDYSAVVMVGVDRQGMLYVEADLARRPHLLMAHLCAKRTIGT